MAVRVWWCVQTHRNIAKRLVRLVGSLSTRYLTNYYNTTEAVLFSDDSTTSDLRCSSGRNVVVRAAEVSVVVW